MYYTTELCKVVSDRVHNRLSAIENLIGRTPLSAGLCIGYIHGRRQLAGWSPSLAYYVRTIAHAEHTIAGTMCAPPNGIVSHGNFRQFARRPDVCLRRAKVAHTRRRNTFSVCNSELRRAGEVRAVFFMPARGWFASSCELGNRRAPVNFQSIYTQSHLRCSFTLHLTINFYAPLIAQLF